MQAALERRLLVREKSNGSKLTNYRVLEIREHIKSRIPQSKIAAKFGICQMTVSLINQGKIWNHI